MGHILHYFGEMDLRCQHHGLSEVAKREKIDVRKLKQGEYLIFVNHRRDKVKVFTASNVIAYLKLDRGQIDLNTIQYIPQAFEGSGKIDYDAKLKEVLTQKLIKKGRLSPLQEAKELKKMKQEAADHKANLTFEDYQGYLGEDVTPAPAPEAAEPPKKRIILRKTGER